MSASPVRPTTGRLVPLGLDEVRITGGFWGDRQRVNAEATLAHCVAWMDRIGWIGNFDRAADGTVATERAGVEFVDSEVYKLLEAMAWELGRSPSPALELEYLDLVGRVAAAQEEDGYLHTAFGRPGQRPRYSDLRWGHELYCFGHLFQAAVARLRTGHDDLLPAVARRLADHVWTEFGRDGICGHPEIEMALVELGRATGEERYVVLGRLFLERRGHRTIPTTLFQDSDYFLDDEPVREASVLRGHAVRAMYLAAGAVDAAVETRDRELLAAVERQWATTVARRTYLTGGVGAHHQNEAFGEDFELPADRAYAETCAAIGSVMLSHRLLLETGEAKYADLIERTLLNAVLVGGSEDGRAFFYSNTLHQRHAGEEADPDALVMQAEAASRAPWFEVSCCPTNVARTIASAAAYFATRDADGVQLHQYGDLELDTVLDGGTRVSLQVRTGYPAEGRVEVTVRQDAEFTLTLRVPPWAGDVTVDGPGVTREPGAVHVGRAFRAGERVVLDLPMSVRTVRADPRVDAVRGQVAFERGPLVLSLESTDAPEGIDLNAVAVAGEADHRRIAVPVRAVPVHDEAWPYGGTNGVEPPEPVLLPLRPYASWGNRGPATMRVWIPEG